jgi:hypothetical protein
MYAKTRRKRLEFERQGFCRNKPWWMKQYKIEYPKFSSEDGSKSHNISSIDLFGEKPFVLYYNDPEKLVRYLYELFMRKPPTTLRKKSFTRLLHDHNLKSPFDDYDYTHRKSDKSKFTCLCGHKIGSHARDEKEGELKTNCYSCNCEKYRANRNLFPTRHNTGGRPHFA